MATLAFATLACASCGAPASHLASESPPHGTSPDSATGATSPTSCTSSGPTITDAAGLDHALTSATPGATIVLAPGTYSGNFVATVSGTAASPITMCGPRDAVIDGGSIKSGYALHLNGASWWNLVGFSVRGSQKGVMVDHADHVVISGMSVHDIGDEAVHLRSFSSYDTVEGVTVRNTGLNNPSFGEGLYVGSAHTNWCRYSSCAPDASNYDVLKSNDIAGTTAENIDIKEGTTGGVIVGNRLSGLGMVAAAATAWVNVKGNSWTLSMNVGAESLRDGFQVHQVYPGWGKDNVLRANTATVDGPGYGIYVQRDSLGTLVACTNVANGAGAGLSNVACT